MKPTPDPASGEPQSRIPPLHFEIRPIARLPVNQAHSIDRLHLLARSCRLWSAAAVAALAVSASASSQVSPAAPTAPPMERVPAGDEWELDFTPKALRVHIDDATGKAYWVLTYEVGNRTSQPRNWAPVFELQGDGGPLQRSGREVPSVVTDDVKRMLNRSKAMGAAERPPVLDQNQAIGLLPVGRAHIRDGFAVWPVFDPSILTVVNEEPSALVVYVGGVSNRRGTVKHPATGDDVVLRQQKVIRFETPGRVGALAGTALKPVSETLTFR